MSRRAAGRALALELRPTLAYLATRWQLLLAYVGLWVAAAVCWLAQLPLAAAGCAWFGGVALAYLLPPARRRRGAHA